VRERADINVDKQFNAGANLPERSTRIARSVKEKGSGYPTAIPDESFLFGETVFLKHCDGVAELNIITT